MKQIIISEEVLQQALSDLRMYNQTNNATFFDTAYSAIESALQQQPIQEPYGYYFVDDRTKFAMPGSGFSLGSTPPTDTEGCIPLYTKPQLQQPLNESEWFALVMNAAAELEDASNCLRDIDAKHTAVSGAEYYRNAAKKALSKARQSVVECAGEVVSANCEYATVRWLRQTSSVGGGDPKNSWSWPITGDKVYLLPPIEDGTVR